MAESVSVPEPSLDKLSVVAPEKVRILLLMVMLFAWVSILAPPSLMLNVSRPLRKFVLALRAWSVPPLPMLRTALDAALLAVVATVLNRPPFTSTVLLRTRVLLLPQLKFVVARSSAVEPEPVPMVTLL